MPNTSINSRFAALKSASLKSLCFFAPLLLLASCQTPKAGVAVRPDNSVGVVLPKSVSADVILANDGSLDSLFIVLDKSVGEGSPWAEYRLNTGVTRDGRPFAQFYRTHGDDR